MFNPKDCAIPTVYCGNKKTVPKKGVGYIGYVRKGTPYECLQKGYGAGYHTEKAKHLKLSSLQHIKYVGDLYESNFRAKKINTLTALINRCKTLSREELKVLLEEVFLKKDGVVDMRAYNSTLLYLYNNGVHDNLPPCTKIKL